jgi:large subunit ribosomal protein L21
MYAVIRVGGKQERVKPGDVLEVELMHVDPGSSVEFQPLVVVDDEGKAHHGKALAKAKVVAKLLGDKKGEKLKVFKYRPKSGYRRSQGHRQMLTLLEVEEVGLSPGRMAGKEEPAEEKVAPKKAAAKKPTPKKPPGAKPAARKPAAKKPAAKKPAAKKPAAKKPAAKKPAAKKPAARKPAGAKKSSTTRKPAAKPTASDEPAGSEAGPDDGP